MTAQENPPRQRPFEIYEVGLGDDAASRVTVAEVAFSSGIPVGRSAALRRAASGALGL